MRSKLTMITAPLHRLWRSLRSLLVIDIVAIAITIAIAITAIVIIQTNGREVARILDQLTDPVFRGLAGPWAKPITLAARVTALGSVIGAFILLILGTALWDAIRHRKGVKDVAVEFVDGNSQIVLTLRPDTLPSVWELVFVEHEPEPGRRTYRATVRGIVIEAECSPASTGFRRPRTTDGTPIQIERILSAEEANTAHPTDTPITNHFRTRPDQGRPPAHPRAGDRRHRRRRPPAPAPHRLLAPQGLHRARLASRGGGDRPPAGPRSVFVGTSCSPCRAF